MTPKEKAKITDVRYSAKEIIDAAHHAALTMRQLTMMFDYMEKLRKPNSTKE